MDKCKFCGNLIPDIESITHIGSGIDYSSYTWAGAFKIFMEKFVPEGELWIVEHKTKKIHRIINIKEKNESIT
jgi:hypothetical protein